MGGLQHDNTKSCDYLYNQYYYFLNHKNFSCKFFLFLGINTTTIRINEQDSPQIRRPAYFFPLT